MRLYAQYNYQYKGNPSFSRLSLCRLPQKDDPNSLHRRLQSSTVDGAS
jgi:hypothetical protein